MLTHWEARTLDDLLAEHDLAGTPEEPFPNDGWSGAQLTSLRRGRERFVLKRTSWATDWIARATRDHSLREGFVAANRVLLLSAGGRHVPDGPVVAPYLGAAADGTSLALLMPDLSNELIAWERPAHEPAIDLPTLDRVVDAMARLHFLSWPPFGADGEWPWCPIHERIFLLSRRSAMQFRADGITVAERFLAGWAAFERLAPPACTALLASLEAGPEPLLLALGRLPAVGLHGDLKLANVALLGDHSVGLIDWQMTALAPVAIELGWFLVSNAALLPEQPDDVLRRYLESARWFAGRWSGGSGGPQHRTIETVIGDWDAQVDLAYVVGLLLRGWRKGLDAAAGATLTSGVSAEDDLADWCARAVEAARRRL